MTSKPSGLKSKKIFRALLFFIFPASPPPKEFQSGIFINTSIQKSRILPCGMPGLLLLTLLPPYLNQIKVFTPKFGIPTTFMSMSSVTNVGGFGSARYWVCKINLFIWKTLGLSSLWVIYLAVVLPWNPGESDAPPQTG